MERKVERVAKSVGEEQACHREAAIIRADLEDVPSECLAADDHVVLQMHGRFRRAGRARRVQPEGDVVLRRRGGVEVGGLLGHQFGQPYLARPRAAGHYELGQEPEAGPNLLDRRRQLFRHDGDHGAAVVQDVLVVARLEEGIGGNRHCPDFQGAPEGIHEFGAIGEQQQHALLHADADPPERVAAAVGAGKHVAVRDVLAVVPNRDPLGAALPHVAVHEPRSGVEVTGNVHLTS